MKEGFTFKWASLKFLRIVIFKNFGGGGGGGGGLTEKSPDIKYFRSVGRKNDSWRILSNAVATTQKVRVQVFRGDNSPFVENTKTRCHNQA